MKPFTDVRVRKALTLGIDRYTAGKVLYAAHGPPGRRGLMRPGTEWAMPPAELEKLPGFWRDAEKSRAEAKRLLAEAGYPNGFKVVLKNRNVKLPYQDFGGVRDPGVAQDRDRGRAPAARDGGLVRGRAGPGELRADRQPAGAFIDDPDLLLNRYITGSPQNWGRFSNPAIDDLFSRQARTLDPAERRKLVIELQKIVLENAYYMPGLWWTRNVVHWAKVKNYVAPPSHYTNQKLQDVWLSED